MALVPIMPSSPGENEYPSGFPPSICDEVPAPKYLCSHCDCVLNGAHQSSCGHRYCLACVHWLLRRNNKNLLCTKCKDDPNQRNNHGLLTLDQFFNDAAINKEILALRVHCANTGCTWKSTLQDFEEHQSHCEYALIPCNVGCGLMVLRKTLANHLEKGCPNNKSTCPTCSCTLTPPELQKHVCPSDKKATKAEKRQKDNKQANSKRKEPCLFTEVGCTFKGNVEKLRDHESCSSSAHLQLLLKVLRGIQVSGPSPPERSVHFPGLDLFLHGQSSPSICTQSTGEMETDGMDGVVNDMALSLHDDQAELEVGQQLHALQQRLQIMENIISALNREVEKTQITVTALDRDTYNNMQLLEHLESVVADQQQKMIRKDLHIASLQQSISTQQDVSYDGTFLWKICDVSQKLREAATGLKSSQYSPAFYTSRYGFKVCMRLYLNGDGVGKGTHISLFFVIIKGEYDPLLSWPFKHKVTFFLIDQNQKENVIDTFRPDLLSVSFQRPVSEMNVASGCPLFCPLAKLRSIKHAYCKDDTLFIKCVVDSSS